MKKDGYFESKRLKLPRTSTTAELHRPLTLSLLENFEYSMPRRAVNTDADRETTNVHTNLPKKKRKKQKEKKEKKKYVVSTPLHDEPTYTLSLSPSSREWGNLVTPCQTQDPYLPYQVDSQ